MPLAVPKLPQLRGQGLLAVEVAVGPYWIAAEIRAVAVAVGVLVKDQRLACLPEPCGGMVDVYPAVDVLAARFPGIILLALEVGVPFALFDAAPAVVQIYRVGTARQVFFHEAILRQVAQEAVEMTQGQTLVRRLPLVSAGYIAASGPSR